jgi:hypothetical protein
MALIDTDKPIRTVRSKRRMFVVGERAGLGLRLDFRQYSHPTAGTLFGWDGQPVDDDCPLGPIENYEEESPFLDVVDVHEKREREAFQARVQDELGDHELFGLF